MIMLDEADRIFGVETEAVAKLLVSLLNKVKTQFVLVGAPRILTLNTAYGLERRSEEDLVLAPYRWESSDGQLNFRMLLKVFQARLSVKGAALNDFDRARRIYVATGGHVSIVSKLLVAAVRRAAEQDRIVDGRLLGEVWLGLRRKNAEPQEIDFDRDVEKNPVKPEPTVPASQNPFRCRPDNVKVLWRRCWPRPWRMPSVAGGAGSPCGHGTARGRDGPASPTDASQARSRAGPRGCDQARVPVGRPRRGRVRPQDGVPRGRPRRRSPRGPVRGEGRPGSGPSRVGQPRGERRDQAGDAQEPVAAARRLVALLASALPRLHRGGPYPGEAARPPRGLVGDRPTLVRRAFDRRVPVPWGAAGRPLRRVRERAEMASRHPLVRLRRGARRRRRRRSRRSALDVSGRSPRVRSRRRRSRVRPDDLRRRGQDGGASGCVPAGPPTGEAEADRRASGGRSPGRAGDRHRLAPRLRGGARPARRKEERGRSRRLLATYGWVYSKICAGDAPRYAADLVGPCCGRMRSRTA